jgi:AcrR family transcriptional regulator
VRTSAPSPDTPRNGSGGGSGIRARKKRETHHALQAAARRLVAERGLDRVTVEEIAGAANVSKRTFFNYFESKEAAVVDAEPGMAADMAAALAARPADEPPLESLRALFIGVLTRYGREWGELTSLIQANPTLTSRHLASYREFEAVVLEWAARRSGTDPRVDVYPALVSSVLGTATQLTFTRWHPEAEERRLTDIANEVFDLLASGLALPRQPDAGAPAP